MCAEVGPVRKTAPICEAAVRVSHAGVPGMKVAGNKATGRFTQRRRPRHQPVHRRVLESVRSLSRSVRRLLGYRHRASCHQHPQLISCPVESPLTRYDGSADDLRASVYLDRESGTADVGEDVSWRSVLCRSVNPLTASLPRT